MSQFALNSVTLGGNLTRDPELRTTPSGTSLCKIGLAVNARRKDANGNWVDKPNYFDVTIWGGLGENVARSLTKGSKLAVVGRLEWRQWSTDDGQKRSAVGVVADTCFFEGRSTGGNGNGSAPAQPAQAQAQIPTDDIPFS